MDASIKALVAEALEELKESCGMQFDISDDMVLIGEGAVLDSMAFVSLVADIEDKIADAFDKNVSIVSEKAFSKKYSPFKTVARLCEYIEELIAEQK